MCFSSLQAIGYYIASKTTERDPGIVCVISRDEMHIIIFPYRNANGQSLVNAVSIPFLCLREHPENMIALLALVSHRSKGIHLLEYPGDRGVPKEGLQDKILLSELDEQKVLLEQAMSEITALKSILISSGNPELKVALMKERLRIEI